MKPFKNTHDTKHFMTSTSNYMLKLLCTDPEFPFTTLGLQVLSLEIFLV